MGATVELLHSVKLTLTIAATHGTDFMIGEPTDKVMRMSAMLAPHTPREPLCDW
jgi:hypothetical protein